MAERCSECHDTGWVLRGTAPARVERCECRAEPAPPAPPAAAMRPHCTCHAGDEAYLARHSATCAIARYAQPKCSNCARAESELAALREEVEKLRSALTKCYERLVRYPQQGLDKWRDAVREAEAALREGQKGS